MGVASAPPAVMTSHCQSEPQPSNGSWPPVSSSSTHRAGASGAGRRAQDKLRERQLAQNQFALQINHKANGKKRRGC